MLKTALKFVFLFFALIVALVVVGQNNLSNFEIVVLLNLIGAFYVIHQQSKRMDRMQQSINQLLEQRGTNWHR